MTMATDRRFLPDYPHPSTPTASVIMKANRGRDTMPELRLRSLLHGSGMRYRVHLPVRVDSGRPISVDIAFPRQKLAVFVDGCFWHGCTQHRTVPVANSSYWAPKLQRNANRDRATVDRLHSAGWTALRLWEHDDPGEARDRIASMLDHRTRL
ncbi:MAG: very short patch repair endonuclease [Acidimicrobiales bacterium]